MVAGCGGAAHAGSKPSAPPESASAEAQSAAAGDVPDNQRFLTFHDASAGYSIKYPEGWVQTGSGEDVTFRDKDNSIHVVVASGGAPTPASVQGGLPDGAKLTAPALAGGKPAPASADATPKPVKIAGSQAVRATYTVQGPPNPVTGKRLALSVDRYVLARGGRVAIIDLGTPVGVDNVDAFQMVSQSFQWS